MNYLNNFKDWFYLNTIKKIRKNDKEELDDEEEEEGIFILNFYLVNCLENSIFFFQLEHNFNLLNLKTKSFEERKKIIDEEIEKFKDPKFFRNDSLYRYLYLVNKKVNGRVDEKIVEKLINDYNIDINYKNEYGDTALFEV